MYVMSITYDKFNYKPAMKFCTDGWELTDDCNVVITLDGFTDKQATLRFTIAKGYFTDGASVPKPLQWFLKGWMRLPEDNINMKMYNLAPTIHDIAYGTKGFDHIFNREECDDLLRGIWRCAGLSRFKAGVADKAVEVFAGGENHWGDEYVFNRNHLKNVRID